MSNPSSLYNLERHALDFGPFIITTLFRTDIPWNTFIIPMSKHNEYLHEWKYKLVKPKPEPPNPMILISKIEHYY